MNTNSNDSSPSNADAEGQSLFARHKQQLKTFGWMLVHGWIVFHLIAIVLAPASVPPAAPVVQNSWRWVGRYLQATYLNHGYHFFAPDPGGATLIEYRATMPDGSTKQERIPNRDIFPRLLYHRHFMLTEHMAAFVNERPELEPIIAETYAHEVHRQTGATEVIISELQHDLSSPQEVLAGQRLNDPLTYYERSLGEGEYRWNENGE